MEDNDEHSDSEEDSSDDHNKALGSDTLRELSTVGREKVRRRRVLGPLRMPDS